MGAEGETLTTQKVTLTVDCATPDGKFFVRGSVLIIPSFTRLGDPVDLVLIEQAGARAVFDGDPGKAPVVDLFPCDLIGPQTGDGPGWSYTVYYDGAPGAPQPWSFCLLSTGGTDQRLSSLAQMPAAATVAVYLAVQGTPVTGAVPTVQSDGTVAWAVP